MSTKVYVGLSSAVVNGACLSPGQKTDMKCFPQLWAMSQWKGITYIIADKGYDYYDVRCLIRESNKVPVIPRRKNAFFPGLIEKHKPLYRT